MVPSCVLNGGYYISSLRRSPVRPHTCYFVCATQRSGSTLLCELLKNTHLAGYPEEYFDALRSTGVPQRPLEYFIGVTDEALAEVFQGRTHPDEEQRQPP